MKVWIRVFNLPLECMEKKVGLNLAKRIGETLNSEDHYYNGDFGLYLWIRVGLNYKEMLPYGIDFLKKLGEVDLLPIKFENGGILYFHCGKIGRERIKCTPLALYPALCLNRGGLEGIQ